ncbi:MAG: hypothetical protein LBC27_08280 [Spirochaetaceae bacterium]|nr:hypothetical protein [Spirochaetaceae bacterium]
MRVDFENLKQPGAWGIPYFCGNKVSESGRTTPPLPRQSSPLQRIGRTGY